MFYKILFIQVLNLVKFYLTQRLHLMKHFWHERGFASIPNVISSSNMYNVVSNGKHLLAPRAVSFKFSSDKNVVTVTA